MSRRGVGRRRTSPCCWGQGLPWRLKTRQGGMAQSLGLGWRRGDTQKCLPSPQPKPKDFPFDGGEEILWLGKRQWVGPDPLDGSTKMLPASGTETFWLNHLIFGIIRFGRPLSSPDPTQPPRAHGNPCRSMGEGPRQRKGCGLTPLDHITPRVSVLLWM